MKLKHSLLATALFSAAAFTAHAATELTPQQAESLKPFKRITLTGRFNALGDAAKAVSRRADDIGAASFYIVNTSDMGNSGNWRVAADLYRADALKADKPENRIINGLTELPKAQAYALEPFDTVTVQGYFPSQPDINDAITKEAKKKGASSFYVVRQVDANSGGGNQRITAYIYKADAPKRIVQTPDAIPADSDAGRAALAAGGSAAKQVEIPGVASSEMPSHNVGRFFETQTSKGGRYTVTLADGTKIEELNKITAAQMAPFDSVTFTGHFSSMTDVSYNVAKRAAKKGAKYYHVTRQWQERGGNMTISADLFK
ncbi:MULTISPECIES: DUF1471 family protein YdgH [Tenebrionibacter/Tenebrionicola group]|jgi:hypothetical protein|uniref:DUF1471 domain-containing protein n=2 Tax=Tenebrionibacter/Tenebrionicola group TaxID=2969848 RepID=A0A8K0V3L1_9ENTR|nr:MULTISPECIES: DUF1471 family protein YdgH [Tenebrionibacter/Tenebrionicola group]MBK4716467.1 DUF1471 domain-containing protein [Tenebrionibacter intestinalis]MBV4413484.1 DUF1471 domain-containing protein [Tenebrionicola larvae]MBV5096801.1 DUF1471 domain-containing protein [Tenebrionicola larvae]